MICKNCLYCKFNKEEHPNCDDCLDLICNLCFEEDSIPENCSVCLYKLICPRCVNTCESCYKVCCKSCLDAGFFLQSKKRKFDKVCFNCRQKEDYECEFCEIEKPFDNFPNPHDIQVCDVCIEQIKKYKQENSKYEKYYSRI